MGHVVMPGKSFDVAQTPRRRRLQFSLRTTLMVTLIVAVYLTYLMQMEAKRNQLVREIESAGGNVTFDESLYSVFSSERITEVSLPHARIQEIGAGRLTALPKLATLSLTDFQWTTNNSIVRSREFKLTTITKAALEAIDASASTNRKP